MSTIRKIALFLALLFMTAPASAVFNQIEVQRFTNISANTSGFTLRGGTYGVTVHASFGGGTVTLQRLTTDGSTYVTVLTAFSADGYASANLPSGTYRLTIATATAVYADVVSTTTTQ
jgi:hypothetical protein